MSEKILVPAVGPSLPDIGDAIASAFNTIMGMIAGALNTVFGWFWEAIVTMFTTTPAPITNSENTSFRENPSAVFLTCKSDSLECSALWENTYEFYSGTAKPLGIIFLVLGIIMSQATKPMKGVFPNSFGGTGSDKVAERAILGIIGIQLWWTIGTIVLEIAYGLTQGILEVGELASAPEGIGSGTLAVILVAVVVYTVASTTILVVLMFWILRYMALFMLMAGMPIIIGLWTFRIGPLTSISDFAKKIGSTFTPLAFATVPAALVIIIGQMFTGLGSGNLGLGLSGIVMKIITFIIGAVLPLFAGIVPIWFFNQNQRAVDDVKRTITRKKEKAEQSYNTATSRHGKIKRESAAARSAVGGGPAITYTEDADGNMVAREVDDVSNASTGYQAMRSVMSGGNKAKKTARASAELGGDVMFKPKATAASGMVLGKNTYEDKKDSISNTIEKTSENLGEKGKQTMAKGYLAGVDSKQWAESKKAQSDMDVYNSMETRRDFASTAARGTAATAGGAVANKAFRPDADPTNPQLVNDDGEVMTDREGNTIVSDDVGGESNIVTGSDGERLTNEYGEPITEQDKDKYEQTSDGDYMLDDQGAAIPKEAARDDESGDPIKDDSQGNYVTEKRISDGEFLETKEVPEAPDSKKITIMTETGPEQKTIALDESGKAMVRDQHRFEPDNE